MISHRTTARAVLVLAAMLALTAGSATAAPDRFPPPPGPYPTPKPKPPPKPPPTGGTQAPRIIFPVVGPVTYTDDFGDPRPQGPHQGNDIMAPRKALAVAAEAGKVKFHTTSRAAGCMLYLYGDSGTTYIYIHLNNDVGNGNDNKGKCVAGSSYAPGLKSGERVEAGEHIGYVGDSGDADGVHPHLHFEVHPKDGKAVSPYPYLRRARKLLYSARSGTFVTLALTASVSVVGTDELQVKVSRLTILPGRTQIAKVGRSVTLTMPTGTPIQSAAGKLLPAARLVRTANVPVIVWTEPAGTTLREKLGTAGALSVARVIVNG
jgi:hypothetical protein